MSNAPFPITPELVAVTLAYVNKMLIADDVSPRVPVGTQEYKYQSKEKGDNFTIPNTHVGRKSKPNMVEFGMSEVPGACEDYALDDGVPQVDIDNAPEGYDPVDHAVETITNLILLDREVRVANLVFDAANYAAANKVTLAGGDQWSDFGNSDPIEDISAGLDACIMRPNVMAIGREAFSVLSRHPKILKAYHGTAGDTGIVRKAAIAELFELEEVLVGEAWVNTAKKGQTVTLARAWGKHCSLLLRDRTASTRGGLSFTMSPQFGNRIAGQQEDPDMGMRGGVRVRVGESIDEIVIADDLGYFIQNAAA